MTQAMKRFWSSREVAAMLGVRIGTLSRAVWEGRVDPPEKSPSGGFLWTLPDIQRGSWYFRGRSADDVLPATADAAGGGR